MASGEYQTTNYQRNRFNATGASLPAVLRELADDIERDQCDGWQYARLDIRETAAHGYRAMPSFGIRIDRSRYGSRLPAGVGDVCGACGGYGVVYTDMGGVDQQPGLNVWDDECECYRCTACNGTGYELAERRQSSPVPAV